MSRIIASERPTLLGALSEYAEDRGGQPHRSHIEKSVDELEKTLNSAR